MMRRTWIPWILSIAIVVVIAATAGWWLYRNHVGHRVLLRATGGDKCKPNVFINIGHDGKSKQDHVDHADLPWQGKTYEQRRGDLIDLIVTGDSECGAVQCQLSIDGVDADVKTAQRQVHCTATVK